MRDLFDPSLRSRHHMLQNQPVADYYEARIRIAGAEQYISGLSSRCVDILPIPQQDGAFHCVGFSYRCLCRPFPSFNPLIRVPYGEAILPITFLYANSFNKLCKDILVFIRSFLVQVNGMSLELQQF